MIIEEPKCNREATGGPERVIIRLHAQCRSTVLVKNDGGLSLVSRPIVAAPHQHNFGWTRHIVYKLFFVGMDLAGKGALLTNCFLEYGSSNKPYGSYHIGARPLSWHPEGSSALAPRVSGLLRGGFV